MTVTARDIMHVDLRTVPPEMPLPELERLFLSEAVGGFPVVKDRKLIGIVSRSDVIRQLCVEQSLAEQVSDYYREMTGSRAERESLEVIADRVGERIEHLRVRDVMTQTLVTILPDLSLEAVAATLVKHHIHRVLVTDGGRLVGIITMTDLVKLVAEGKLRPV